MTTVNVTLAYRHGWLCAAETEHQSREPIATTWYWPLSKERLELWQDDIGKPLYYDRTGYSYSVKIGGFWKTWHLADRGQTKALAIEHNPVPKPKGLRKTTETRWHQGAWQKYTAKEGWIRA